MKILKITALILITALLISFVACSDNTETDVKVDDITSNAVETTKQYKLIEADYKGYNFTAIIAKWRDTYTMFIVEEESGEVIDDSIYKRNKIVEDIYNISLSEIEGDSETMVNSIIAQEDAYDIMFNLSKYATILATEGYYKDLNKVPYIDLNATCWDQKSIRDLSVGKKVFGVAGDIHLGSFEATWMLMFDKEYQDKYNIESPYDIVNSNKWTFDKLSELCLVVTDDINGDSIMNGSDTWGLTTQASAYLGLILSSGARFSTKDENDYPVYSMNTETFINAYNAALKVLSPQYGSFDSTSPNYDGSMSQHQMFIDGRSMFFGEIMGTLHTHLRDKKADFGIIPWPKLNEEQTDYYNMVLEHASLMYIPVTVSDEERTGAIIQTLCTVSTDTVRAAYYDVATKIKFVRDEASAEMLDLVFNNRVFDMAMSYNWGSCRDIEAFGRKQTESITSFVVSIEEIVNNDINKLIENLEKS